MSVAIDPKTVLDADEQTLDKFPFGVICLDRHAVVTRYNRYEAELGRKDQKAVIGTNFFRDVAPCTAVQDFKGRWEAFLGKPGYATESFDFIFKFAWGHQRVHITFVKKDDSGDVTVLVTQSEAK